MKGRREGDRYPRKAPPQFTGDVLRPERKQKSRDGNHQDKRDGVSASPVPAQELRWAKRSGEPVHIRDYTRSDDRDDASPGSAGKESTLQRERGHPVSERVHWASVRGFWRLLRAGDQQAQGARHDAELHRN